MRDAHDYIFCSIGVFFTRIYRCLRKGGWEKVRWTDGPWPGGGVGMSWDGDEKTGPQKNDKKLYARKDYVISFHSISAIKIPSNTIFGPNKGNEKWGPTCVFFFFYRNVKGVKECNKVQ